MGLKSGQTRKGLRNLSTGVSAIPDSGISRFEFEQNPDDSWGSNDATDNTSAGYTTDNGAPIGTYAKSYDGTDDIVNHGSPSEFANIFDGGGSVSAWIKHNSGDGYWISKDDTDNGWFIRVSPSNGWFNFIRKFDSDQGSWRTDTSPSADTWYHVVVTYDSSSTSNDPTIYIDGSADTLTENNTPSGTRLDDSGDPLITGAIEVNAFNQGGDVDLLDIYDKELSAQEVSNLNSTGSITG